MAKEKWGQLFAHICVTNGETDFIDRNKNLNFGFIQVNLINLTYKQSVSRFLIQFKNSSKRGPNEKCKYSKEGEEPS